MIDGTPVLRAIARRRVAQMEALEPAAVQERLLLRLVARAKDTRFGRAHGFDAIRSVADFQARVPLRRYEAFWEEWWKPGFPTLRDASWPGLMPYFALSSGTTSGTTKHIPVSAAQMRANRGAALDMLCWHLANHPTSRPFAGLSFMLGGSTALRELAPGVRAGDLSAIAAVEVPRLLRAWSWPPDRIALTPDWDAKLDALARETPREKVRVLSGTPSWVLMLLHRMAEGGAAPLPNLELLVHGGVAWAPYRDRFAPLLPPGCATREVYPASEGFLAIADRGDGEGLRLVLDRGLFFEFVPVGELDAPNPTRHWVADVETGVDYAVVLSSNAGLFGYVLGDVVRFVERRPPRLLVTGRTAWMLSAFGEHVTGEEMAAALAAAARQCGAEIGEWCCGPEFLGTTGRHRILVESAAPAPGLAAALDAALMAANEDYEAHRRGGQMAPPEVETLRPGAFEAWMRATGRIGGQNKVPRVIADPARFAEAAAALARS
jgi:hypothetical protein